MSKRKIQSPNTRCLQVLIKPEEYATLEAVAQANETNISTIVRPVIRKLIQELKQTVAA